MIDEKKLIKDILQHEDVLKDANYVYKNGYKTRQKEIIDIIERQPTVEAVLMVHAEWIHVPSSDMATGQAYECSNCKKMRYGSFLPPFCQMCGADMRKKELDEGGSSE